MTAALREADSGPPIEPPRIGPILLLLRRNPPQIGGSWRRCV